MRNTVNLGRGILLPLVMAFSAAACSGESASASAATTAASAGASAGSSSAPAQGQAALPVAVAANSMVAQVARMGGGMQAAAEYCGDDYSSAQLDAMKQQQKQMALQRGGTEAEFEAGFKAGFDEAKQKLAQGTPEQRAAACEQLRALGEALPQG